MRLLGCSALGAALLTLGLAAPGVAQEPSPDDQVVKNARENRSAARVLLAYLPNRLFDVLDLVRLRARVGPGVAVRARATEQIDVGIGSYASLFAGLPGPRCEVEVPLPVGLETYSGVELVGDAEVSGGYSPEYAPTEIGVSAHVAVVGVDFGVDPVEVADLLAGFVLLDLRADDY
jgi:hypothetical protein